MLSAFRSRFRRGVVETRRAVTAMADLLELPMTRAPDRAVLARVWELRASVSACDGAYVALAEAPRVLLLTADRRLARAGGAVDGGGADVARHLVRLLGLRA